MINQQQSMLQRGVVGSGAARRAGAGGLTRTSAAGKGSLTQLGRDISAALASGADGASSNVMSRVPVGGVVGRLVAVRRAPIRLDPVEPNHRSWGGASEYVRRHHDAWRVPLAIPRRIVRSDLALLASV